MIRAKIVDHYLSRIVAGEIEIVQIRQDLEARQVPEEEIRVIVRLVDNELQRKIKMRQSRASTAPLIWAGAVVAGLGVVVMVGTYTGIIQMGRYFVVPYGAILAGASMAFSGLAKRRR